MSVNSRCARRPDAATQRPISINLILIKNLSDLGHLHWAVGAENSQGASEGPAATQKLAKRQCRSDHRHKRITRFHHYPPATDRLATHIPRGKKSLLPTIIAPVRARSVSWPASRPERIHHHF